MNVTPGECGESSAADLAAFVRLDPELQVAATHPDKTPLNTDACSLVGTNVPHSFRPTACLHPSHRTVRLFMAYAEANSVRSRLAEAVSLTGITVSELLRIDGGSVV